MEFTQICEIGGLVGGIATVLALMLVPMIWVGSKIDASRQELNQKIDACKDEVNNKIDQKIDSFRQEVQQDMNEFRTEIKDFHGRLCSIEERNKGNT